MWGQWSRPVGRPLCQLTVWREWLGLSQHHFTHFKLLRNHSIPLMMFLVIISSQSCGYLNGTYRVDFNKCIRVLSLLYKTYYSMSNKKIPKLLEFMSFNLNIQVMLRKYFCKIMFGTKVTLK